ncbi:MAG: nucleotidyltransferase family protein, partial [Clostridia bacterium]|nr:nucleotidyltransferase family protein [Clostridia bacterium]
AARNEVLSRISVAFENEGIDFIVLKGAVIQGYYPSPELRVMSDIDIYIKTEDRKKAKNVLSSLEIPFLKSNSYQDIYKTRNGIIIEVHHALWGYNLEKTKLYTDIWDSSNVAQGKKYTYTLSSSDLYVFVIAHLFKHFKESGIGIRPLFDIWFIFKKSFSDIDFDYVKSQLSFLDAIKFEKKIRKLVKAVFLKEEKDDSLLLILDYMLKSRTHGATNIAVANATKGKNRLSHIISRLFPPLSQMKRRYNILDKIHFLLPFFWLWRIITLPFMKDKLKSNINKVSKIDTETQNYVENVFIAAGISTSSNKKNKGMSLDLKSKLILLSVIIIFLISMFCLIYFRNEQTGISNTTTSENEESIVSENESSDVSEYVSDSSGNNYGTISWKRGRYTGYLTNNIPNGSGEHIVENSFRYVGFFVNGSYEGFGKIEYSDGSYYEGEFKKNQANGEGTLYCANGDIINGIFSEGQPGGFCNYEYSDGNLFTGTMINGLKHGEGTFYWLNGDKYVGSFVDDRRDGYGILYYSNGDTYQGNWSQGFCNGFGTYLWSNGTKYEGNFEIGLMNDTDC